MFEEPIRRKTNAYPKDFTRPGSIRAVKSDTKDAQKDQFSFSCRKDNTRRINSSAQLQEDPREQIKHNLFTINPEDSNRLKAGLAERQKPLINIHINRRVPYINPELLSRPKMEENTESELHCVGDSDLDTSMTPGSIRKNHSIQQTPLLAEAPFQIKPIDRQETSNKRVENTKNIFQQSLRSQYLNFTTSKAQKLANLGRVGGSQAEGQFKTVKKNFSFSDANATNRANSHLLMKRGNSEEKQKQEKKKILGLGYLFEQKRVSQIKQHINLVAFEKTRSKNQIKMTQETQPDNMNNVFNSKSLRKRKIKGSTTKFYPELAQSFVKNEEQQEYLDCDQSDSYQNTQSRGSRSLPKFFQSHQTSRRVKISYKTSLNNLKDIFESLSRQNQANIEITVPNLLMNLRVDPNMNKTSLYHQTLQIFQGLGIPVHNPTVKRYSNCVLMVNKNVCVLAHYNSKVYLGGWQTEYLDEGVKHGLGLEWVPGKYVYYGEFASNKRQGLGVMKTNEQSFMGTWTRNKRTNQGVLITKRGQLQALSHRMSPRGHLNDEEDCEEDPLIQ